MRKQKLYAATVSAVPVLETQRGHRSSREDFIPLKMHKNACERWENTWQINRRKSDLVDRGGNQEVWVLVPALKIL